MDELLTESNVWIDDILLQDMGITVLLDSSEQMLPELRTQTVVIPGRVGAYDFGAEMGAREFSLNCVFSRQSYTEMKRTIRKFVRLFVDSNGKAKTVQIRFGDATDEYFNVRIAGGVPVERVANLGLFTLPLIAHDPRSFATFTNDEVIWGSNKITFTSELLLGTDGNGTQKVTGATNINVINNGDVVRPRFIIKGTATSVRVSINGKFFSLPAFSSSEWVIDGDNYSVTKNGANALSSLTGDFLALINGTNQIAVSGSGLNIDFSVIYRENFI